jgi:hypothetical protein
MAEEIRGVFEMALFDDQELRQSERDPLTQATAAVMERYFTASQAALETFRAELDATIIDFVAAHPDAPLRQVVAS